MTLIYSTVNNRADIDGEVNLSDTGSETTVTILSNSLSPPLGTACTIHHLYRWYTWEPKTGWYWHAYNSAGASDSNVWGIFQGPASNYLNGGEMAPRHRHVREASHRDPDRARHLFVLDAYALSLCRLSASQRFVRHIPRQQRCRYAGRF